ncbi:unnamed protein product [Fusarium equiseti]|uniref:Zn(2)-C6 fungal-type domain-containing protein n=1 Tax=Fusarium equiseti TaxID=61235 RepID=A0A8J2IHT2_FUSEQ|nr:unnamed protein product [Fusarium equiseti]
MEPIRRRRRPAVACTLCRKRKMRCNRESPCSNCKRSRQGDTNRSLAPDICGALNRASLPTPEDQSSTGRSATVASFSSPISMTPHSDLPELEALKSKLRDIMEIIDEHTDETSDLITGYQKCKALGKRIKNLRVPVWPTPLTTHLVSRAISDSLVECYFGTIEKLHRVLHSPTFQKNYDAMWASDSEPHREFLVQLRLVHALGATTYDDNFSLRASATQWIYEAQTWISEPEFKSRLGIQFLQTNILLLLAREIVAVSGETMWIGCGALLRTAMSMGLHRDPTHLPQTPTFVCEMRRRIWNTILELCLQSSMSSGGPPMVSVGDFDTEPPGNFDDDQILTENPISRPDGVFTQTSTARALRKTYSSRLNIAKLLNDLRHGDSYQETLRLDAELKASYKEAIQTLQSSNRNGSSPSEVDLSAMDFIMRRYLSALHFPFFGLSLKEPSYAFSRKMTTETAFRMWSIGRNNSSAFARFVTCSTGFFRTATWLASVMLLLDLRNQVQEDDTLSPTPLQPDIFNMMQDAKPWTLKCVEAGETNIKGHLITCLLLAQIKGTMNRLSKEEMAQGMIRGGEEATREAFVALEASVVQLEPDDVEFQAPPLDFGEDWDLMLTDGFLNGGAGDPMSWIF